MGYIALYEGIIILLGIIFAAVVASEDNRDNVKGVLFAALALLVWPVTLTALPFVVWYLTIQDKFENAVRKTRSSILDASDPLAKMSETSTHELKQLLKGARKGVVELSYTQIQALRQELINRAAENGLLK